MKVYLSVHRVLQQCGAIISSKPVLACASRQRMVILTCSRVLIASSSRSERRRFLYSVVLKEPMQESPPRQIFVQHKQVKEL